MNTCIILGVIAVGIIWLAAAFLLICICHKRIMTSATAVGTLLMALFASVFCIIQQAICHYAPNVWGISIFFLVLIVCILLAMWFLLTGTLIVKEDCLYRLTWYMIFRKYTYAEIDHYTLGWDRTTVNTRFGPRKSSTYEIDVQFCDNSYSTISFRNENDPKAVLLREMLRAHRCLRKK